ncbi:MAG: hypothetical protein PVG89_07405 [Gammaproteobacteria bacterium]|jgi:hypothetical protein
MLERIPKHVWHLLIMCVWGGAIIGFNLVRFNAHGVDEGAAMALLLNWSVSDQIINPVTTYGGPDFRALLFIPLGLYWPGSIIAAKVFTLMFCFASALLLYYWNKETEGDESALIATGLFLISPLLIYVADTISIAPFLLTLFGAGLYLDKKYRASPHSISSLYFIQMLVIAIVITLHPMGLAYPLALAWQWYKNPKSDKQKKQVWAGIGITTAIILAMQTGWIAIPWGANPLVSLHNAVMGYDLRELYQDQWVAGAIMIVPLVYLVYRDVGRLSGNLMGSMLLLSLIIGLSAADQNWAMIAMVMLLYRGIPAIIQLNKKITAFHFMGQRGIVFAAILLLSLFFMQGDKIYAKQLANQILSSRQQLIQRLAEEAADPDQPFLAASQWPAQTMIVCKRDVLKLPPPQDNGKELLAMIKNITHIMFDHRNPANHQLASNIAELGGYTETVDIQPAGVIVKIRENIAPNDDAGDADAQAKPKDGQDMAPAKPPTANDKPAPVKPDDKM